MKSTSKIIGCLVVAFTSLVVLAGTPKSPAKPAPDFSNVKYGPHERNVFDLWKAKSAEPTPLFVYIHGGGWRSGDKSGVPAKLLTFMLQHTVSVAAVNYRYSDIAKLPAP